jgi:carotenoid cleavage dioxygenase-like enzyme
VLECLEVLKNTQTDVYIINLKSGDVKEMSSDIVFSMHHINAYETNDGEDIVLDLAPTDEMALKDYPLLKNMLNPPENSTSWDTSTCGKHELTRYTMNIETGQISYSTFPNLLRGTSNARFVNKFDMGVINEAYRGREYCIIYGWSAFDYSRNALVKKNVCDASKDKVLYWENHYPTEMYFIANPEGSDEDDGVLVSISFDGALERNYLLLLDAKSFEEIDRAYLPHNIPFPLSHGHHFPDAKWTI